jgi:hypothetical protein
VHWEPAHTRSGGHTALQLPQFCGLLVVSMQLPPHSESPGPQTVVQAPFAQVGLPLAPG